MLIYRRAREKRSPGGQDVQQEQAPGNPTPQGMGASVKSTILHIIALAQYALTYSRSWAADSSNQRVRLKAECDRLEQELALRGEEIRIKDIRMAQIDRKRRPHYPATEAWRSLNWCRPRLVLGAGSQGIPGNGRHHQFVGAANR